MVREDGSNQSGLAGLSGTGEHHRRDLPGGPTQDGPFSPVSDPIPAQGGPASGASYEYMDKSYPGGTIFYQLREIESNGRELLQGRAAPTRARARAASGPLWPSICTSRASRSC